MRPLLLIFTMALPWMAGAQFNPLLPPNTFAADDNPYYWKNKKPHAAYWQQDVHYAIKASLDDQLDRIDGTMHLVYTNNSPKALDQLVFHMYQNAFDSGSYAHAMHGRHPEKPGDNRQHITVSDLSVNRMKVTSHQDNTLLFVQLESPILPGEKAEIECSFTTWFGTPNGRMKMYESWGYKHYNVVHWYPRIAVYDQKFGWTTDQHLGHEFYGDFGTYDVELTLPGEYILDGTGFLLNRAEVLPPALMEQLRIEQYADKAWNEAPSQAMTTGSPVKTWRFHAENVHDFAWTADPTYRIGEARAVLENGREVVCYALAQEPHAAAWQNAAAYAARIVEYFSREIGEYAYHKMIVADARDGMEYPMLTLDGGRDPGYRSLFAHEIGHNWFFGMVGNNETYRAALDEGFTQYLTARAMTALEGDSIDVVKAPFSWDRLYPPQRMPQFQYHAYLGYYYAALIRGETPALNTHSDHFKTGSDYSQVYSKTATMLYNLEYVLGEELFDRAMKNYFEQWKFCHPYDEDFRASVIQFTGVDLNWFFDQWLTTEESIDYKLNYIRKSGPGQYKIKLTRKGMQMPIDLVLYGSKGEEQHFHIPNMYFVKDGNATVLPRWYGWNERNRSYEATITTGMDVTSASIDPSGRLADVYQLDNHNEVPIDVRLNDFKRNLPQHFYELEWNPVLWYTAYDGAKVGFNIKGDYFDTYHLLNAQLWVSSGIGQQSEGYAERDRIAYNRFNYSLDYTDPLRTLGKGFSYTFNTGWMEGLLSNRLFLHKELNNKATKLGIGIAGLYRPSETDLLYLLYPDEWNANSWNNHSMFKLTHVYHYGNRSRGKIRSELRSPFAGSDYNYAWLNLDVVNDNHLAFLNVRTRVFAQYGTGSDWAPESRLFAAGANPEKMMEQALTRSVGLVPDNLYGMGAGTGNYHVGGGLNLRGYNNYLLPEINGDSLVRYAYAGMSGASFNTEIEFDGAIKLLPKLRRYLDLSTYVFADAGVININRNKESLEWSNLRMDAGLGATLEIKRWGSFTELKPFRLRADFPLFLNRPPADEDFVQFRWLIGFQRAF